jgi:alcohol dehydrogenase class IV
MLATLQIVATPACENSDARYTPGAGWMRICRSTSHDNVRVPMPPAICIPTTAGTSADLSQFVAIVDGKIKQKLLIISKTVVPQPLPKNRLKIK